MKAVDQARTYDMETIKELLAIQSSSKQDLKDQSQLTRYFKQQQKQETQQVICRVKQCQRTLTQANQQRKKPKKKNQVQRLPSIGIDIDHLVETTSHHSKSYSLSKVSKSQNNMSCNKLNSSVDFEMLLQTSESKLQDKQSSFKWKLHDKIMTSQLNETFTDKVNQTVDAFEIWSKQKNQMSKGQLSESSSVNEDKKLQVIQLDKQFGKLLTKIKGVYEESLTNNNAEAQLLQVNEKVQELTQQLQKEKEEKYQLQHSQIQLSEENTNLKNQLNYQNLFLGQLQENIKKLQNDFEKQRQKIYHSKSETATLIQKMKQSKQEKIMNLKKENKMLQKQAYKYALKYEVALTKFRKLLHIINVLKDYGIPVEIIYDNQTRDNLQERLSNGKSTTCSLDNSEIQSRQSLTTEESEESEELEESEDSELENNNQYQDNSI